ncbi:MAG TPA: hypothetical protein VG672_27300, partial [Bryobacteraceae bacterium]|nr:hypothetical protein [Bryobacteraceae bacterium]
MRCWLLLLLAGISAAQSRPVHLVIEDGLLARIGSRIPAGWSTMRLSQVDGARLVSALAGGDHLIWIGAPAALPADLWIGAFRPVEGPVALS